MNQKKKPQVVIINEVDEVRKLTIVENIIKEFEKKGKKVRFNRFKKRRQNDEKFKELNKKYKWLFRKQIVEEINRKIIEYNDEDIIILDKSSYNEKSYREMKIIENIEKKKKYELNNNKLYRIKKNKRLLIIKRYEFKGLLYMIHNYDLSVHFGINATYEKFIEKKEKYIKKNKLHPIKIKEPFYQIGIDFVGPLLVTKRGNKYIIIAIDYFTKCPEIKVIKKNNAEIIAEFIYEEIICRHGIPQRIISDRGIHFKNKIIEELMKKFNIKHKFLTSHQ
ncbi:protein NYNRIN-like [Rhizophagus clarus]|uniref:Protein NYNRIN-like n=1 Tax=Rhizophagus clarus TaxID=94130 RepID=A0A8H3L6T2_9GLOM|nr:protein NYNRIN-like [Rhizophagus clarus]